MKLNSANVLIILIIVMLALPTVSFANDTKTQLSSNLESPTKSNLPRGWTTFSSNQFSVSYPSGRGWVHAIKFDPVEPLRVVFGPENKLNGQDVWTVTSYSTNVHSRKSVLKKVSQVQSNESAKTKRVKISGTFATMVTVSSKDSKKKKRISVVVSGESMGRADEIYVLSNAGLSEKGFETFYKSFRVVPVPSKSTKSKNITTKTASSSSRVLGKSQLDLELTNISNPNTYTYKNGVITATPGDRMAVGLKKGDMSSCALVDPGKELKILGPFLSSETDSTIIEIDMPFGGPSKLYKIGILCGEKTGTVVIDYKNVWYEPTSPQ